MLCHNHNHDRLLGLSEHCHRCKFWIGEILVIVFCVCVVTTVAAQVFEGGCVQFQHCTSNAECGGGSCMESVCICTISGGGDISRPELCNARDDDNDGLIDEDFPGLGNRCDVGIGACFRSGVLGCSQDTVSTSCSVESGLPVQELCGNNIDDDCDGGVDEGCAQQVCEEGASRNCNSGQYGVCSAGTQQCRSNSWGSCVATIQAGSQQELCGNNIDDDCDGGVDEGCTQQVCEEGASRNCNSGQYGVCSAGTQQCRSNSWGSCVATIQAGSQQELCGNNIDDDCDGGVDEGCMQQVCEEGASRNCNSGQYGVCSAGTQQCRSNSWGSCVATIQAGSQQELCGNNIDDDCDGGVDEGCTQQVCEEGTSRNCNSGQYGVCSAGTQQCRSNSWGSCVATIQAGIQQELCGNNIDDDCDGGVDEGCTQQVGVSNSNAPVSSIISLDTSVIESLGSEHNIANNSDDIPNDSYNVLSNTIQQENMITPLYYDEEFIISDEENLLSSPWIFGDSLSLQEHNSLVEHSRNNWIYRGFMPDVLPSSPQQLLIGSETPLLQKQFAVLGPISRIFARDWNARIPKKSFITQSNQSTGSTMQLPTTIVPDALYVSFDTTQLASIVKLLAMMQSKSMITKYYQPFISIDIPYYRIEFDKKDYRSMIEFFQKMPGVKDFRSVPLFTIQTDEIKNKSKQRYLQEVGIVANSSCLLKQKEAASKTVVAIVDNAFDVHHPVFTDTTIQQIDIANNDTDVMPPSNTPDWAHGTIAASLIDGFEAKKFVGSALGTTRLVLVKGTQDTAEATDITHGIEAVVAAADAGAEIISLSRGTNTDVPVFKEVIRKIIKKGILVVAAAGNQSSNSLFYPAAYDGVIAVGAYDTQQQIADFSNFGTWVDVMAPGVDILAAGLANSYIITQGTSEAGPIVAGVLALQKSLYAEDAFARSISNETRISGIPILSLHHCDEMVTDPGNAMHTAATDDLIENSGSLQRISAPRVGFTQSSHDVAPTLGFISVLYNKAIIVGVFLFLGMILVLWGIRSKQEEKLANQPITSIHQ